MLFEDDTLVYGRTRSLTLERFSRTDAAKFMPNHPNLSNSLVVSCRDREKCKATPPREVIRLALASNGQAK